jgi:hypothetical protein
MHGSNSSNLHFLGQPNARLAISPPAKSFPRLKAALATARTAVLVGINPIATLEKQLLNMIGNLV